MSNTINKSIKYTFILLAILAFAATFAPQETKAFSGYTYRDESGRYFIYNYNTGRTYPYQPPTPVAPANEKDDFPFVSGGTATVAQNPAPIIYSTTPDSMNSGKGTLVATIDGANFIPSSVVKWNGSDRETTYIDSNHLTAKLTSEDMAGSGEYIITVFNPAPGGGYSNGIIFTLSDGTGNISRTSSNSLGANAIGAGSFMPRTIVQWLLFIILILLGVVLWRKIYLNNEKKNVPLKHA